MIATIALTMLILDGIWLTLQKRAYGTLVQGVQGHPLTMNLWGAGLSYLCMIFAVVWFAVPLAQSHQGSKWMRALMYGGTLGLVIYGVFNFTNIAIFRSYTWNMAIRDTLWGIVLLTLVTRVVL